MMEFKATFNWRQDFDRFDTQFTRAQMILDLEVLKDTDKFIPMDTGAMKNSGLLSTDFGSGLVSWKTPYVRTQYYDTQPFRSYDPIRGSHWFDRSKSVNKYSWINKTILAFEEEGKK